MLLIDAAQIHVGGAVEVLTMVIDELNRRSIEFVLIKDRRLKDNLTGNIDTVIPIRPILRRRKVYQSIIESYHITRALSLINYPAPYDLGIPTVTYFHNMNILASANTQNFGKRYQLMQKFKRYYLWHQLTNTDYFVFQSNNALTKFISEYTFKQDNCKVFPFYKEKQISEVKKLKIRKIPKSFVYISLDYPHKNHALLLDVWEALLSDGYAPSLILTIPFDNQRLCDRIEALNSKGCQIQNHGLVEYRHCLELTSTAEFCIYPSKSESLGLGLVESHLLGNKIIASDLDYVYQAVVPSTVFDPESLEDMKKSVVVALTEELPHSQLKLKNKLEDFVTFVTTCK